MTSEYSLSPQFIDLKAQQSLIREELNNAVSKVLDHGHYIMGPEVKELEQRLIEFTGAKSALTCANGTDAITLILMAWGVKKGDIVFVPAFTYVASAEAPAQLGATPFFVDVKEDTFNIDPVSLKQAIVDCRELGYKPSTIITVDLFGQPSDIDEIMQIAENEGLKVLVDGAQSFGASYKDRRVGSMGHATTTSFFPAKPLGCYGDGGAVFTDDLNNAEEIDSLRLHGKGVEKYDNVRIGLNSRLDTIQAAILIEKLKIFDEELIMREKVAQNYTQALSGLLRTPKCPKQKKSAWAQYTVITENRVALQQSLKKKNIPSVVYYPKSLNQQEGYASYPSVSSGLHVSNFLASNVLSLPMHPYLSHDMQSYIIDAVKEFFKN